MKILLANTLFFFFLITGNSSEPVDEFKRILEKYTRSTSYQVSIENIVTSNSGTYQSKGLFLCSDNGKYKLSSDNALVLCDGKFELNYNSSENTMVLTDARISGSMSISNRLKLIQQNSIIEWGQSLRKDSKELLIKSSNGLFQLLLAYNPDSLFIDSIRIIYYEGNNKNEIITNYSAWDFEKRPKADEFSIIGKYLDYTKGEIELSEAFSDVDFMDLTIKK